MLRRQVNCLVDHTEVWMSLGYRSACLYLFYFPKCNYCIINATSLRYNISSHGLGQTPLFHNFLSKIFEDQSPIFSRTC